MAVQMAKRKAANLGNNGKPQRVRTTLRVGDTVVVISGGNQKKVAIKGKTGKITRFLGSNNRVVVEGVKKIFRFRRMRTQNEASGIVEKDGSVHISNVMYYYEPLKRGVRLRVNVLADGRKVRGFTHPETKQFEQIDA